MFRETNFTTLDLSDWDMTSASRLDSMFRDTPNLTAVAGLATWDTSNVEWMSWMFMNATGFTSLDLTNLDTSSTERMAEMFRGASTLEEIVGINGWETGNVETIASMFRGANRLVNLDLSNWNTSSIGTNPDSATNLGMASAFRQMERLESLNLEGWDTRHLTPAQMAQMFSDSNELRVLTLGENWVAQGTPNQQGLVTPTGSDYTGRWRNVGAGTPTNPMGNQSLTPAQLMTGAAGVGETWVWERVPRTVTFYSIPDGGGVINPASPHEVNDIPSGTTLRAAQIPSPIPDPGYEFAYWESGTGSTYELDELLALPITMDRQFTAIFVPIEYIRVAFDLGGGFYGGDANNVYRYIPSGEAITPARVPSPTRPGWSITGWVEAGETDLLTPTQVGDLVVTAPRTFVAQWEENNNQGPGGPWGPNPEPAVLERQAYLIGTTEGLIRPNVNITRAEVATIFFRLITDNARVTYWMQENSFPDVELQSWFNNAVSTMTNAGVFTGLPDGSFAPNQAITRAEMATAIVRFMEQTEGVNLLGHHFDDISDHWAVEYINTAAVNGWVQGYTDGTFRPNQAITRAETAAMINRISGRLVERTEDLLSNMITWPDNANTSAWYYFYIQSATNSYRFTWRGTNGAFEHWISLIPARVWTVLERPDSSPLDILRSY